MTYRALVIGGGITGLAAVERLAGRFGGESVLLVERDDRLGGKIRTDRREGFVLEGGPDCFLAMKPGGVAMCRHLGLVQDRFRPSVSESRERPVLISGLDGDPPYNMYPEQYGKFIDFMNLKRFGGWWYNAQERFDFIRLKDSPLLAHMEGLRWCSDMARSNHCGRTGQ